MSVNNYITDPTSKKKAEVIENGDRKSLVVATHPLKSYTNSVRFFSNDTYGINMNQNAATSGTPDKVHDGTDSALWTGTSIEGGKFTFDSTDQNHTTLGSKSVKIDNPDLNDVIQFAKGSNIDLNNYVSITLWVYVDKDYKIGDSISFYGWDTATNTQVGVKVYLEDYFNYLDYDVWHKITIPLTAMNLTDATTVDSLRLQIESAEGKSPKMYLDDIQFEQTGTPITYCLEPDKGTWLHVSSFQIIIVDAYDGTLANSSMPKIPYDGLLGLSTLDTGITYTRITNGEIITSSNINDFIDLMSFSNSSVSGSGTDATNTWVTVNIKFTEPVILKHEDDDSMCMTVNDDLSGLIILKVGASTKIEDRSDML